jgi:hypothetical protein
VFKIALQNALPRRSLYVPADAKPAGFTRAVPVVTDILSVTKPAPTDKMSVASQSTDKMSVATPAAPVPYADWIARLGLSPSEAAKLLGVTERTAFRWSANPDTLPPLAARVLAMFEHAGLDATRIVLSGLDGSAE